MATAVQHPPSMDRTPSFDQPRSRSTPPFAHRSSYERSTSPSVRPPLHHRTSSNASASSPYNQPFPSVHTQNYFPPVHHPHQQPQAAWASVPIPSNAFYPSPMQLHPGQSFHQGFQQSQADFAAWATAYHQMVAASAMNGGGGGGAQYGNYAPQPEYLNGDARRRTSSGPSSSKPFSHANPEQGYSTYHHQNGSTAAQKVTPAQHASHPYKRAPTHRPSRENVAVPNVGMPRSVSNPTLTTESRHSPASSISTPTQDNHKRTLSFESGNSKASVVAPPRVASRQDSYNSERERNGRSTPTPTNPPRANSPAPSTKPVPVHERPKTPQPLHSGPIANATNTPSSRPSPLSQASAPEMEKPKTGGLKNRLRKVLDKDTTTPKKQSTAPSVVRSSKPTFPSPSETSTRSATPPVTPPQSNDFPPPSAPFAISHPGAMGSEISLAETDRTATAPSEMKGKSKRSLFRMKNMSTDNISLSSTVSSASMMIRKMGSIGKLARRNRLVGLAWCPGLQLTVQFDGDLEDLQGQAER